ncbi:hypothetical protein RJ641_022339 [Dillenia turbinata]|uniref:Uncharacterized protein n=1 Tax=Dillenia turbinata TaxID=194707 RepID=A0AAN8YX05_9MAGN
MWLFLYQISTGSSLQLRHAVLNFTGNFVGKMNFLLRSSQTAAAEPPSSNEHPVEEYHRSKPVTTLEGLIAEDPYQQYPTTEDGERYSDQIVGGWDSSVARHDSSLIKSHSDVTQDEGWIIIPQKELPENWADAPDICSFHPLDRPFVFSGEQVNILACLSACKKDTEIITPFKVAAVMSKNGIGHGNKKQNGHISDETKAASSSREASSDAKDIDQSAQISSSDNLDPQNDLSAGKSLLRLEDFKRQTETLLRRFQNSHFFVRFAESGEPLWSKKSTLQTSSGLREVNGKRFSARDVHPGKDFKSITPLSAVNDRGNFDATVCGGVANAVKCCTLPNGDIVVLLQVNVGVDYLRDPILEILQFEKNQESHVSSDMDDFIYINDDPCGELLKWLLPLDNTLLPPARSLSPPHLSNASGVGSASHKSGSSYSTGSQLFSFGHFRSYSMSSLPQNTAPSAPLVTNASSKPTFDQEDRDQMSSQKLVKGPKGGAEGLLSFRGIPLEPERFSVNCGLEGIYTPGRRWRRKLEIIQPIEISSFAADCNTDDLLCVQIKNVAPAHTPDLVVYLDAITVIFEEASKSGPPISLPITCIEAGNDHSLPNLILRRGEEHSFILKPATSMWKISKTTGERSSQSSHFQAGCAASSSCPPIRNAAGKSLPSTPAQYAVLVSCRCNYTVSRLFFKQPTSWQPRISRDLMISVASEMSNLRPNEKVSQLPVQVLTLQASNLTSEDLTLTVLAPASFTSPPSVVSFNSSPSSPNSPFVGFSEITQMGVGERRGAAVQRLSSSPVGMENKKQDSDGTQSVSINEQVVSVSDVIPNAGLGCTHLWLQSRVPLGCVPSQSTATIKLELLPLTDGIITLDTLQIDVKEKGLAYIPEHPLKINATSSIASGIF